MLGNFRATFGYIVKQLFLNLLAQSIHALSLNNTFFSMLVKIFSNKSYFCFSANIFFGLQCIAGLAFEVDWFESLTALGDHCENFEEEECFQRECQGETLSGKETKEVFIFLTKSVRS